MIDPADRTASQLLALIREVAAELNLPSHRLQHLNLDTTFDRELGLDSLSRMEVLARVEKHFGITLPERLLAEADPPEICCGLSWPRGLQPLHRCPSRHPLWPLRQVSCRSPNTLKP